MLALASNVRRLPPVTPGCRLSPGSQRGCRFGTPACSKEDTMPLFMDVHNKVEGATAEAVAGAHEKDLET